MNRDAGKGSLPRPMSISVLKFNENWENTFKKPVTEEEDRIAEETIIPVQYCPPLRTQVITPENRDVRSLHTR
jgi:hypothetical protein